MKAVIDSTKPKPISQIPALIVQSAVERRLRNHRDSSLVTPHGTKRETRTMSGIVAQRLDYRLYYYSDTLRESEKTYVRSGSIRHQNYWLNRLPRNLLRLAKKLRIPELRCHAATN